MTKYLDKVRTFGPRFMRELDLKAHHVAGMFGNFAVETGEFKHRQEIKPTVAGSKGGIGWAQWTGYTAKNPRRRDFEAFVRRGGFDLKTEQGYDEACFAFVVWELRNTEKGALTALKQTTSPESAAKSFCLRYERPGVQHMAKRQAYAKQAHAALVSSPAAAPAKPVPSDPIVGGEPILNYRVWERGKVYPELKRLQDMLRGLGYRGVGQTDGRWGSLTRNSLLAFKADNALALNDALDDATWAAILKAEPRKLPAERENATAEKLAPVSPTIQEAQKASWWSKASGWAGGAGLVIAGIQKEATDALSALNPFRELLNAVPGWLWVLVAVGVGYGAWKAAKATNKVEALRVEAHKAGGVA